jgi:putative ABC transport system permease protein
MTSKKLKLTELVGLSLRSFRAKPQRAALTILGMSIGIATVIVLVSLGYGLQFILIGQLMTTEDSLITMEISYPSESNLTIEPDSLEALKNFPNVAEISPVAEFPGEISTEGASSLLIDTRIVDSAYFRLAGILPNVGTALNTTDGTIVSGQILTALGAPMDISALGQMFAITVLYQAADTSTITDSAIPKPFSLQGIILDDAMSPTAIINVSSLSKKPPFFRKVLVKAENVDVLETLRDRLLEEGFSVSARIDLVTQARQITNIITIVLGAFGVTALIVSAIGMFNTMTVGFLERIYEVGILKSIGATDADVRYLFLVESSLMGFFGGLCGVVLGVGLGGIFNIVLSFVAVKYGGSAIDLFLTPVWFMVVILVFSAFIGFVAGWVPAHKAAKLSPKEAFDRR